ncbi:MAG: Exodeoxyribonuclease 7 large subunit [Acidimicrobiales bacterium]|jgi:exodeoxyribonuclease VII large subunit|nr:Exodeoxyribonuclease 7 large subunit [Acidimicrobiales bacterium]
MTGGQLFDATRKVSLVRLAGEIARAVATIGPIETEGEVHRPQSRPGGSTYFLLKDRAAQLSVWAPADVVRRGRVRDGERVAVIGRVVFDNNWGRLQLTAESVLPVGAGAVAAMIAEARQRLAADGLLARPRKPIPRLPAAIGVVCGADAAVRADIESVVAARFPGYPVVFAEVTVSGPNASDNVVAAMAELDARPDVDVIVLARGGGDATQLLPFSDEALCRAVCRSGTAVVSAIGHDGDRPLCDEVADLRCGTPSIAAHTVVPDRAALLAELDRLAERAAAAADARLAGATRRLAVIDRHRAVTDGFAVATARLDRATARIALVHPRRRAADAAAHLAGQRARLEALSPRRVLERGYAVVRRSDGSVVRVASDVTHGDHLGVEVSVGRIAVTVDGADTVETADTVGRGEEGGGGR